MSKHNSKNNLNCESRKKQIEEEVKQLQQWMLNGSTYAENTKTLENKLRSYQNSIGTWNPRFDFDLWDKVQENFEQLWPEIHDFLYLAIEHDLYESVKNIFFDIRLLLHITGHTQERIHIADWLTKAAQERGDTGSMYLTKSSLLWSYTSSGQHQNLDKASELWGALSLFIKELGDPFHHNHYRRQLIKTMGQSQYLELVMDTYEGGVRLAVRQKRFDEARAYTIKARNEISALSQQKILTRRLKERFDLCFCYHEGVTAYLKREHQESKQIFAEVIDRAEIIGWTRAARGAKSWLATLAMELKEFEICDSILADLINKGHFSPSDKRDGICRLLQAQALRKKGNSDSKNPDPELKITEALKRFTDPDLQLEKDPIQQLSNIFSLSKLSA